MYAGCDKTGSPQLARKYAVCKQLKTNNVYIVLSDGKIRVGRSRRWFKVDTRAKGGKDMGLQTNLKELLKRRGTR